MKYSSVSNGWRTQVEQVGAGISVPVGARSSNKFQNKRSDVSYNAKWKTLRAVATRWLNNAYTLERETPKSRKT